MDLSDSLVRPIQQLKYLGAQIWSAGGAFCVSGSTSGPSGFQRTFLSSAGVELRVFWGLFFSVRMTPHGSSLRALTRFFSCQPT
ncbi:hypothetical protein EYF80_055905 [Liparis tanakae]|uniref:Uncharacterized protein n=1 Tax=Liparis tanakae TaxID=230148 RepID=A0A4Z2EY83_9TELE|nr:hypothetical protein EYF80_055905 [Liparis tanakae]